MFPRSEFIIIITIIKVPEHRTVSYRHKKKITVYWAVQIFSLFLISLYILSSLSFSSHSFFFQQPIQIFCTTSYTAGLFDCPFVACVSLPRKSERSIPHNRETQTWNSECSRLSLSGKHLSLASIYTQYHFHLSGIVSCSLSYHILITHSNRVRGDVSV